MFPFSILLIFLATFLGNINGENILVLMPLPARSHFKSFQPLLEELVKRGHNLTLVSGYTLGENFHGKYNHIDVKRHFSKLSINFAEMRKQSRLYNFVFSSERIIEYEEYVLKDHRIQELIASENMQFDSIIVELFFMDVFVAFGQHFNAPVVGLSAQSLIFFYSWNVGNPITPSYIPNLFLPFTDQMSFVERFLNGMYTVITGLYYEFVALGKHQKLMETYFHLRTNRGTAKLKNMIQNVSLILVNSHYSFGYPKSNLPNIIETAGLHITEPTSLPENIEKFINDAKHGVIYVSLGSLIQPDDVQPVGRMFLRALSNLPQKIIFKWNPKILPYVPGNFLVQEWVPQTSILRHPKCRLFITHGGLHSLIESVNYSVPLIGIPFFTDQQHNMALVEYLGIGKTLNIDFKEGDLLSTVNELLSNPKYQDNVNRQSEKFNDRLASPLDTAVYWIEYVMRHDDISHIKSAATELKWYQYYLIDVWIFITTVVSLILYTVYHVVKLILKVFYGNTHEVNLTSKSCSKINTKVKVN